MLFSTSLGRRLRLGIGAWMALASVLALLPMLAFSMFATYRLVVGHQAEATATLERRAGNAAQAMARELGRYFAVLHTLAASDAAMRGEHGALHAQALRIVHAEHGIHSISAADAEGAQRFNTLRPYGMPLPATGSMALHRQAFDAARDGTSPLLVGALAGKPLIALVVPVLSDGRVTQLLRLTIAPDTLGHALQQLRWQEGWTAAVLDQNRVIVARSRDADRFVGQPASPSLRQRLDSGRLRGVFESTTKDGTEVVTAVAPVPGTAWHVAVGEPASALRAEFRDALALVLLAGVLCAVLAAGGSLYLARELGREARRAALRDGEAAAGARRLPVRELGTLATALGHARERARDATQALEEARLDAVTGLPARAAVHERARALLAAAAQDGARGVALLFIDLDGFKAVNDRLGHAAGDRVLVAVAEVLRRCVREGDLPGRLGGDEFVVVLAAPADRAAAIARDVAARIVDGVAAIGDGIGCSVGVAFGSAACDLDGLVQRADQAMLSAKRAGKGRVVTDAVA